MDTPDLPGTMPAFHRVLKPNEVAILVFSRPCFPQVQAPMSDASGQITHRLNVPYFALDRCIDPPCAHFTAEFIWFHQPLSYSWKAHVATSTRATIQARAGEWACHDTAWREAWHQQGILTGGLAVMAYHAATLVRIHESRLSKQARAFRQRLRVRCRTVSQCNASRNE
jgi:hypothetical protein